MLANDNRQLTLVPSGRPGDNICKQALEADLSQVQVLRVDPVNKCNLRCVFCPNDQTRKHATLDLDAFALILDAIRPTLTRINLGCVYEPLFSTEIDQYAQLIKDKDLDLSRFQLVTNGLLLHKRSIDGLIDAGLNFVHFSIHSHIETIFEEVEKRGNFKQLEANVKALRKQYPDVFFHIVNVLCKLSLVDLPGYVRWVFDELGANDAELRYPALDWKADGSPLAEHTKNGIDLNIPQERWEEIVDEITALDGFESRLPAGGNLVAGSAVPFIHIRTSPSQKGLC